MGIIAKPNSFTGQAAPQLPWLDVDFDALFQELNGNLDNTNIKANAGIDQSKIANLQSALASLQSQITALAAALAVFQAANSNARGTHTISTSEPSGVPADYDVWDVY